MYQYLSKYRTNIMGMAALWVMIFHSSIAGIDVKAAGVFSIIKNMGYIGVDIFIFLSGVGIYFSLEKSTISVFYKKRLLRILPYYLIFMLVVTPYNLVNQYHSVNTIIMEAQSFVFWQNLITYRWYVPCILILYFFAPIYFKLFKKNSFMATVIGIIGCFGVSCLLWNKSTVMMMVVRFPLFFLGIYMGIQIQKKSKGNRREKLLLLVSCLVGVMWLTYNLLHFDALVLAEYGLYWYPCFLITPGLTLGLGKVAEIFEYKAKCLDRLFIYLGKYSLEVYLWHYFLLGLIQEMMGVMGQWDQNTLIINILVIIITCIWGSWYHKGVKFLENGLGGE